MAAGCRPEQHGARAVEPGPVPWFVKTETFRLPYSAMCPHLKAHRVWVEQLRRRGVTISSGYLVDGLGRPGGGGLLLLEAADYATAEALIQQDPMVLSGGVHWQLSQWCPAVGDLAVAPRTADG
jgi:uncharacterized protein YciI